MNGSELVIAGGGMVAGYAAKQFVDLGMARGESHNPLSGHLGLGVSKQVISRYKETEYQTVAIANFPAFVF